MYGGQKWALNLELELHVVVSCVGSPSLVICQISKFSSLLSQSLQSDSVTFEVVVRSHSQMMLAVQAFQLLKSIPHIFLVLCLSCIHINPWLLLETGRHNSLLCSIQDFHDEAMRVAISLTLVCGYFSFFWVIS